MTNTPQDKLVDALASAVKDAIQDAEIVTPELLANIFWNSFNGKEQADFFNHLALITRDSDYKAQQQWRFMQDDLSRLGKQVVDDIKDHTDAESEALYHIGSFK